MPGPISIRTTYSGEYAVCCRLCEEQGKPKDTGLRTWDSDEADRLANQHEKAEHPEAHASWLEGQRLRFESNHDATDADAEGGGA